MNPLAFSVAEACVISGVGRTNFYQALKDGEVTARKRGKRTLVLASELQRWLNSLPQLEVKTSALGQGAISVNASSNASRINRKDSDTGADEKSSEREHEGSAS
jgi:excisionase family DNA binding protein